MATCPHGELASIWSRLGRLRICQQHVHICIPQPGSKLAHWLVIEIAGVPGELTQLRFQRPCSCLLAYEDVNRAGLQHLVAGLGKILSSGSRQHGPGVDQGKVPRAQSRINIIL